MKTISIILETQGQPSKDGTPDYKNRMMTSFILNMRQSITYSVENERSFSAFKTHFIRQSPAFFYLKTLGTHVLVVQL